MVIPLYFEEKDLLKYVREFCKQPCVFASLIQNLKMHVVKSVDVKQGLRWMRLYLFLQLTWSATSPARNRNEKRVTHTTAGKTPLAISKGIRAFRHVLEKALRKSEAVPRSVQCREAWNNLRKSGNNLPRLASRDQDRTTINQGAELTNCVVPVMCLFYVFCLSLQLTCAKQHYL